MPFCAAEEVLYTYSFMFLLFFWVEQNILKGAVFNVKVVQHSVTLVAFWVYRAFSAAESFRAVSLCCIWMLGPLLCAVEVATVHGL